MDKFALVGIVVALGIFGGIWYLAERGGPTATGTDFYSFSTGEQVEGQTQEQTPPQTQQGAVGQQQAGAQTSTAQPTTNNQQKVMQATLHTTLGDIVIEFNAATPNTVANFTKLASEGFYNGTKFHRVIKGFMVQGGDPLTKDDSMQARWGTGGPGYQFADEISAGNHNAVGTISMANAGLNTNGSQFFINTAENSFLDTKHTVFGKVVSGLDVVAKIESTPTAAGDRPITPMVITSVELK
jgi:peptidylprolyl isomerase